MKLTSITFAGLVGLVSHAAAQALSAPPATVRVMPFGASIMSGCWRANLYRKLFDNNVSNFDFVGGETGGECGWPYDKEHEGHPGYLAVEVAQNKNLVGWLQKSTPDVILMHIGTNDILIGKKKTDEIIKGYGTLIDQMRAAKPSMRIIISQLLPIDTNKFGAEVQAGIVDLNKAIAKWGPIYSTVESPIAIVDNFTGFNVTIDTSDGEHPNEWGNQKFANKFFAPTADAIRRVSHT
ncbi:SGNH hydrolase-type esterase domain-containing protein [Massariosphaeria phaeospora]|uniref:SGNH hydrolase-type esterase domain-containing protein n=1 Tax=Massariosphaeria phaeospora TaxID=100035 RepID=A0A7C8IHZ4_9PLEO|nr:SGNH hydrolase-type esterase domain-containing protein [Massariosphaeria phaeospora]